MNNQWWTSSDGTGNLALTIKGLLVALVPLSITAFQHYGYNIAQDDVTTAIEAIWAAVAAVVIAVGLIRKIANRIKTR